MAVSKKIACIDVACVACGNCVNYCPKDAISIYKGIYAKVNETLCVGCGKCAGVCPAEVITIKAREDYNEKKLV